MLLTSCSYRIGCQYVYQVLFYESLTTQILVVFVIRTQHIPFFKSKPSMKLVYNALLCLIIGCLLPYLPFSQKLGFEILPLNVIAYLIVLVVIYFICAEFVKRFIYRKIVSRK